MKITIEELKDVRRKLGLTQIDLAKKSGVSQSLIAKIESKRVDPTYSNWIKIEKAISDLGKNHEICAEEIMQKKVIFVDAQEDAKKAIEIMKKHEISQMPVMESGKIIGIISESTILDSIMNGQSINKVKTMMEEAPPIISKTTSVDVISSLLKFFSLIIVSEKGKYIGLITKADLITKLYGKS